MKLHIIFPLLLSVLDIASSQDLDETLPPSETEDPFDIFGNTTAPTTQPTMPRDIISNANDPNNPDPNMPQECSANPACAGLVDDCCPTMDNVFLYCCFESGENVGTFAREFTLIDVASEQPQATYFVSTSTYVDSDTTPSGDAPVISYVRNPDEVYDLVYYQTAAIANANDYVSGTKKFYVDVWTAAPPCTQIMLQLDNLEAARPDSFPIGRHSRFITTTTKQNEWERLEFDFLDRPDAELGDDQIDAIALFFGPGSAGSDDSFYFRNLDSATMGCTDNCEIPSPKSCSALYIGEAGNCTDGIDNDEDGLIDCADSECTTDPACTASVRLAYASATSQLQVEQGGGADGSAAATPLTVGLSVAMLSFSLIAVLASGQIL